MNHQKVAIELLETDSSLLNEKERESEMISRVSSRFSQTHEGGWFE